MKHIMKRAKCLVCLAVLAAVMFTSVQLFPAEAASGSITVTGMLSGGAVLYTGDDLQAAFAAAERGSVVSIDRFITLTSDVVLTTEVMLTNTDRITFGDFRILLSGDGALFVNSRLRRKYYDALSPYSTVEMMEEHDGYVYYLKAQEPTFGSAQLTISRSGEMLGGAVDETNARVFLDASPAGISVNSMLPLVSMPAQNAESVTANVQGAAAGLVSTGSVLTLSATNSDSAGVASRSYTVVVVGDVNGNGRIDAADANQIACHAAGSVVLSGAAFDAADANRDGSVNAKDAVFICEKYLNYEGYTSPLK